MSGCGLLLMAFVIGTWALLFVAMYRENKKAEQECVECCKGINGFKFECLGCGVCPEAV